MGDYEKNQISPLLKDEDTFFRIKMTSGNHETNWMNISRSKLKKIMKIIG
jgi:hypothetical protein